MEKRHRVAAALFLMTASVRPHINHPKSEPEAAPAGSTVHFSHHMSAFEHKFRTPTTTTTTTQPRPAPTTIQPRASRSHIAPRPVPHPEIPLTPTVSCASEEGRALYEALTLPQWYMDGINADYKSPESRPELDFVAIWPTIVQMGCDFDINPLNVPALLKNETYGSGVKPKKGAQGPMQFLPSTWNSYSKLIESTPQLRDLRDKYAVTGNINSLSDAAFYALVYVHRLGVPRGVPSLIDGALPQDYAAGVQDVASKYNGGGRFRAAGPQAYGRRVATALEMLMRG